MLNFKKGGFFSGKGDAELQNDEPDTGAQVLAVWGSPGSGKTTLSVKLAKRLAEKKRNVVLLLADTLTPMLPCICPPGELEGEHSLGSIFVASKPTETLIKHNSNTHKRLKHLAVIGLCKGETESCYPDITPVHVQQLMDALRGMADHVIVDCGSCLIYDVLSTASILEADAVLRLMNCDLKSVSYMSSQPEYLRKAGFDFEKMYKAVSNVKSNEASEHMEQVLGSAVFSIPHSPEVAAQVLAGNLFADLGLKDSRGFRKEIEKISKEVFGI